MIRGVRLYPVFQNFRFSADYRFLRRTEQEQLSAAEGAERVELFV